MEFFVSLLDVLVLPSWTHRVLGCVVAGKVAAVISPEAGASRRWWATCHRSWCMDAAPRSKTLLAMLPVAGADDAFTTLAQYHLAQYHIAGSRIGAPAAYRGTVPAAMSRVVKGFEV